MRISEPEDDGREPAMLIAVLMAIGVVFAIGGRTVTAGVIGANIGGALFLMLGLPLCLLVGLAAVVANVRKLRRLRAAQV